MSLQSSQAGEIIFAFLSVVLGTFNIIQYVQYLRTKVELRRARRNISALINERAETLRERMQSAPPVRYSEPLQRDGRPNLKLVNGA